MIIRRPIHRMYSTISPGTTGGAIPSLSPFAVLDRVVLPDLYHATLPRLCLLHLVRRIQGSETTAAEAVMAHGMTGTSPRRQDRCRCLAISGRRRCRGVREDRGTRAGTCELVLVPLALHLLVVARLIEANRGEDVITRRARHAVVTSSGPRHRVLFSGPAHFFLLLLVVLSFCVQFFCPSVESALPLSRRAVLEAFDITSSRW